MDMDELAKLAESGNTEAMLALADKPDVVADPSPEEPAPVEQTQDPEPETEAHVVATKSGNGTIPYAVLKSAREQAAELARQNDLLKSQLDDLTNRQPAQATEAPAASTDAMEAKIASLRERAESLTEDFPELASSLLENAELLSAMRAQLVGITQEREAEQASRQQVEAAKVQDTVQEAIDATPELSLWQSNHPDVFAEAVEVDALLRNKPEWANKPMAERFVKVAEMVKVMRPDAPTPPKAGTKTPPRAPSLGDIPGGMPPATNFSEQVDQLSASALGNKFMSMTPEQISEYLMNM
jgi:hypothetical protein